MGRISSELEPEPQVPAIDHVQVAGPPGCEPQARRFYGELLGLRELPKPPALRHRGGAWFGLAAGQLHVGVEADFRPARQAHPALRLSPAGLEAVARRLQAAGERVDWDDALPGVRRFYTRDPWGNRLELVEAAGAASIESSLPELSG